MAIQEAFIQNTLGQTNSAIATSSNEMSEKKPLSNVKDKPPPLAINGNKPVSISSEKTPLLLVYKLCEHGLLAIELDEL